MFSLKRRLSNANLLQNSNCSQKSNATKVAKKNYSLKSTPLTIMKYERRASSSGGGDDRRATQDSKNSLPNGSQFCFNKKVSTSCAEKSTKLPYLFSDHNLKSECKNMKSTGNKIKAMSFAEGNPSPALAFDRKGYDAPDLKYENTTQDSKIKSDESCHTLVHSETQPITPEKTCCTKSVEKLPKLFTNIKYRKKIKGPKAVKSKFAVLDCGKNITASKSDQSVINHGGSEVKSILKNSSSKEDKSSEFLRKKVRFDLGPKSEQDEIPKSLRNLYEPLSVSEGNKEDSDENVNIPEKEIPSRNLKVHNRFKVTTAELVLPKKNYIPVPAGAGVTFLQSEKEEQNISVDNKTNNSTETIGENIIPETGLGVIKKRTKTPQNYMSTPSKIKHIRTGRKMYKPQSPMNEDRVGCNEKFASSQTEKNLKSQITNTISINTYPSKLENEPSRNERVPNVTSSKSVSTNTISNPSQGNTNKENNNDEDLYNLLVDKLVSSKPELVILLKTLSLVVSSNKIIDSHSQKRFVDDINHNVTHLMSNTTNTSCINSNQKCNGKDDINGKNMNYDCHQSALASDSEDINSSSSNSSVTSVTSLNVSVPNQRQCTYQTNVKSFKFFHRCKEETFSYDNISGSENSKSEFRNYSRSSTESKKSDTFLNSTLHKLTTLLEELNTKVDKITTNDESQACKNNDFPANQHHFQDISIENKTNLLPKNKSEFECTQQSIRGSNRNESNQRSEVENFLNQNLLIKSSKLHIKEEEIKAEDTLKTSKRNNSERSETIQKTIIFPGNQFMRTNERPEKAGIILYSQSGGEAVIKLIEKSNSDTTRLVAGQFEASAATVGESIPNGDHGSCGVVGIPPSPERAPISSTDVQSILKQITEGMNRVKLTSPSMFASGSKRHRSREKRHDLSRIIQRRLHGFLQSVSKFVQCKDESHRKNTGFNVTRNERKCDSGEPLHSNLLRILFPFCNPREEGSDDSNIILSDRKHECEERKKVNKKKELSSNESVVEWPDVRRTKYPNGTLHYGPLERMPEPTVYQ